MRNLNFALTSLRSVILCASAALVFSACGSDDNTQNTSGGTSAGTAGQTSNTGTNTDNQQKASKGLGKACADNNECESKKCHAYSIPDPQDTAKKIEGKVCSGCLANTDCTDPAKGNLCVPSRAASSTDLGSVYFDCGKGELGGFCSDKSHCAANRVCAKILGPFHACSECATDADCKDGAKPKCVLKQEGKLSYRTCGTKLPDGQRCSGEDGSDDECVNYCSILANAPFPGIKLAVCSACKEDAQCAATEKCASPKITKFDLNDPKFEGGKCVPKDAGTTTGGGTTNTNPATGSSTDSTT